MGSTVTHRVRVTSEMTARLFDREVHPVYATAWLVRHAEEAGRLLIEPHLRPGEDATGYAISIVHERAAAVGVELEVRATVTRIDERECECSFEALGPAGLVGRGTFVQRYVRAGRLDGRARDAHEDEREAR